MCQLTTDRDTLWKPLAIRGRLPARIKDRPAAAHEGK
jgi:hypothetical protein